MGEATEAQGCSPLASIVQCCALPVVLACLQKGTNTSDAAIGQGHTTAWKLCGLDRATTLTLFFEIVPPQASANAAMQQNAASQQFYLQFSTL